MVKRHKVVLLGDAGVGKSTIEKCCLGKVEHYSPDNVDLTYAYKEIRDCVLNIWDIKGDDECGEVNVRHFKNAHIAVIIFDVSKRKSFENIDKWIDALIKHNNLDLMVPAVIIGNKSDLRDKVDDAVTVDEALAYTKNLQEKHGTVIKYIEYTHMQEHTSALPKIMYELTQEFENNPKFKNISIDPSTRALLTKNN